MRIAATMLFGLGIVLVPGCRKNHPPDTPAVPSGPSSGAVGVEYTFSSSATHPDGDDVAIRFDWGDGDTSDWSPRVRPGDTVTMGHAWSAPGTFNVTAQAKARNFTISGWSDALALVSYYGWARNYGGTGDDSAACVCQALDGGYVVAGSSDSAYGARPRATLMKVNARGDLLWCRVYGDGTLGWGSSVCQAGDGGYVVVGCKFPGGSGGDIWLIRTDDAGNVVWDRTYGGTHMEEGSSVQQTRDGGYVVAGSGPGLLLLKTDANGTLEWTEVIRGGWCMGRSVQQTWDGGYIVAALEGHDGMQGDLWLVRTDALGNTLWARAYGGDLPYYTGMSVRQLGDGGYAACFTRWNGNQETDAALIRTDSVGQLLWARNYGGGREDWGNSFHVTRDGGYIIGGNTASYSPSGSYDIWLIKTDADGETLWTRTLGWADNDLGLSLQLTADGGYIIAGRTWLRALRSQALLIKTGPNGEVDEGGGK